MSIATYERIKYVHTHDEGFEPGVAYTVGISFGWGVAVYFYPHPKGGWIISDTPISPNQMKGIYQQQEEA